MNNTAVTGLTAKKDFEHARRYISRRMRVADHDLYFFQLWVSMLLEHQVWMISIVANFSEKLPVLFFFLLLSVSTTNLSCLLATTFSSLRFLFNFTSLQSFESGQRGFLFSHFRVLSSILSLSFLFFCLWSSVYSKFLISKWTFLFHPW